MSSTHRADLFPGTTAAAVPAASARRRQTACASATARDPERARQLRVEAGR